MNEAVTDNSLSFKGTKSKKQVESHLVEHVPTLIFTNDAGMGSGILIGQLTSTAHFCLPHENHSRA